MTRQPPKRSVSARCLAPSADKPIGSRGAAPHSLVRMVLADGALLAALGVVIGVAGAILVTQWMSSLLYEGSPRDPMVLATLPLGLAAIAIGSCDFPARRAAKSDPVMVLRTD